MYPCSALTLSGAPLLVPPPLVVLPLWLPELQHPRRLANGELTPLVAAPRRRRYGHRRPVELRGRRQKDGPWLDPRCSFFYKKFIIAYLPATKRQLL